MAFGTVVVVAVALAISAQEGQRDQEARTVSNVEELRQAIRVARPGATILIAPGVYPGGMSASQLGGEAGRPIVIKAADAKNPPVFEGGGAAFHLSDVSHLELLDLVVTGATGNGINIDDGGSIETPSHHLVLRNITVRDIGPTGNRDGIKLSGVDDFRVEGCRIERWGSGGSGIDMVGCHRGEVVDCFFRHGDETGSNGVQTKGGSSEVAIRRCRFERAGQRSVNIGGSTGLPYFRPKGAGYEARDIVVEDCTFLGSMSPIAFVGVDGASVHHNTIYRPKRWGLRILQETRGPAFAPCRNGSFTNNLVVYRSDEMVVPINIGDGTDPGSFTLERNAWYRLDAPERSRPQLPIAEKEGVHGVDPGFRDAEKGDLRLMEGSRLRDFGVRDSTAIVSDPAPN